MGKCKHPRQSSSADEGVLDLTVLNAVRDKRLVALVRLLARRAAQKAYREMLEERGTPRS